jgi:hypothetical protein
MLIMETQVSKLTGGLNSGRLDVLTCAVESMGSPLWEFRFKIPKGLTVHEATVRMTPIPS